MAATQKGIEVWKSGTAFADATVYKHGLVIAGTDAAHCAVPTGVGQRILGVAQDDYATGELVAFTRTGRCYVIDKAGTLNNKDLIATAGTNNYWKAVLASGSDVVAGVVDGDDASAADDLVLALIVPVGWTL